MDQGKMISQTAGECAKFGFSVSHVCKTRLQFQHTGSNNKILEIYGIFTLLVELQTSHMKLKVLSSINFAHF